MAQRGRPPGSKPKPKLYQYVVVHAPSPNQFEHQLNAMAVHDHEGWRVVPGSLYSSGQFFCCLMEKERVTQETTGTAA